VCVKITHGMALYAKIMALALDLIAHDSDPDPAFLHLYQRTHDLARTELMRTGLMAHDGMLANARLAALVTHAKTFHDGDAAEIKRSFYTRFGVDIARRRKHGCLELSCPEIASATPLEVYWVSIHVQRACRDQLFCVDNAFGAPNPRREMLFAKRLLYAAWHMRRYREVPLRNRNDKEQEHTAVWCVARFQDFTRRAMGDVTALPDHHFELFKYAHGIGLDVLNREARRARTIKGTPPHARAPKKPKLSQHILF